MATIPKGQFKLQKKTESAKISSFFHVTFSFDKLNFIF